MKLTNDALETMLKESIDDILTSSLSSYIIEACVEYQQTDHNINS